MANKAKFIQSIYDEARKAGLTDAAARVMAAQAGIESAYGDRAPGNNFFGLTAGPTWHGPTISRVDKDANGNAITQEFRSYPSPSAGIADRISMMDDAFPAFNSAPTIPSALAALRDGKRGVYYEAPQATYEKAVLGINSKYLPASTPQAAPRTALSAIEYLGGKQYGEPGGGVGVNADKLDPEFANRIGALIQAAEAATGDKVSIFEGFRDPKRSAQLRADYKGVALSYAGETYQPTPGMKGKYRASAPGVSEHNLGMAVDIRAGANPDKYPSGPAYDYMVAHAEEYGLHWFGSSDPAHFEIPPNEYKMAQAGTPLRPFKDFNPDRLVPPGDVVGQTAVGTELDVRRPNSLADAGRDVATSARAPSIDPVDRLRAEEAAQTFLEQAAAGVRPGALGGEKIPADSQFPSSSEIFAPYGLNSELGTGGVNRLDPLISVDPGFDAVGPGPASWFAAPDVAADFGSGLVASSGAAFGIGAHAGGDVTFTAAPPAPARPPAPALVKLASGKMIRVGIQRSTDGKHNVEITDDPNRPGYAKVTPLLNPGEIRGVLDPINEKPGTIAGGIIEQVKKQAAAQGASASDAATAAASAVQDKAGELGSTVAQPFMAIGGAFGSLFSGKPSTEQRLSTIIHQAYGGDRTIAYGEPAGEITFGGRLPIATGVARAGSGVRAPAVITAVPAQPKLIAAGTALAGTNYAHVGAAIDRINVAPHVAQTPITAPTVADARAEQRQARQPAPAPVSTATVRPATGGVIEAAGHVIAGATRIGGVASVPSGKPAYRTIQVENPDYVAWEKRQNVAAAVSGHLSGGDTREVHGVANVPAVGAAAAVPEAPPPQFIPKRVATAPARTPISGDQYVVQPGDTLGSIARRTGRTVDELARVNGIADPARIAAGARLIVGGRNNIAVSQPRTSSRTAAIRAANQNVQIASGRTVNVGAMGTSNGGRYVYQVQADGSVKELNSGRITAPAPHSNNNDNGIGTHWDISQGGWVGGGQ